MNLTQGPEINRHGDKTNFHRGCTKTRGHINRTGSNRTGDRLAYMNYTWKQKHGFGMEIER